MGKKIIEEIPSGLTKLYKSHVPTLSVIEVTVNAVHFHKGTKGDWSNKSNYSLELIDADGNILPRMVCEQAYINGEKGGYYIKNNLHLTHRDAIKRLAKNARMVIEQSNPEIEKVDKEILIKNLEIIKEEFPEMLI